MMHWLKLEWLKYSKQRLFRFLVIAYVVLLPLVFNTGKHVKGLPPEIGSVDSIYIFPGVWTALAYLGNWLVFFMLGFMGVLIITSEIGYRTMRQNIITGMTRTDMFKSKLIFALIAALLATIYYIIVALAFGLTHTEYIYSVKVFQHWDYPIRYFLMSLGYMSLGMLIGIWLRRTGIAIFLFFVYSMFIESALRWGIHRNIIGGRSMHFYPINCFEDLCPFPFLKFTEPMMENAGIQLYLTTSEAIIASIAYIVLFLFLTYRMIKTKDL